MQNALYKTCTSLAQKASEGMRRRLSGQLIPPISSSGILSKLDLKISQSGSIITIETQFPDYAGYIEYGRRPGKQPPVSSLVEWCRQHSMEGKEYVLARKIGREGIKPRPFTEPLQRMIHLLQPTIKEVETKEITKEIMNDVKKQINIEL